MNNNHVNTAAGLVYEAPAFVRIDACAKSLLCASPEGSAGELEEVEW